MSRNQRLSFLGIAAVIAVVAVIAITSGGGGSEDTGSQASETTATPTATETATATAGATETATPTPTPKPRLPVLRAGRITKLEFTEGDTIRFSVRSDTVQEVHVHGYDLKKDTVPGKPITFSFKATITGIFEVEFEATGEHIGELRVDPE